MTPGTDGREAGRAAPQPATMAPSTAGIGSKQAETLPPSTLPFSGPKQGLPPEFGCYRVQKLLGGGGMGAVYLIVNTELEREEALKVPHFDAADDPQVRERFLREAKAAAGLDHPNLCPVYDVGVRDGVYYLTMRYLQGKLLSKYGAAAQPSAEAVEIVVRLARAVARRSARRATEAQRVAIGFVGELLAFEWLKRQYPSVTPENWRSAYRNYVFGGTSGDDSLGFDFEIFLAKGKRLFEVKTSSTDRLEIELGETEVATAQRYLRGNQYRILFIQHALDSASRTIHVLPNPFSEAGRKLYRLVGTGLRYQFDLKR